MISLKLAEFISSLLQLIVCHQQQNKKEGQISWKSHRSIAQIPLLPPQSNWILPYITNTKEYKYFRQFYTINFHILCSDLCFCGVSCQLIQFEIITQIIFITQSTKMPDWQSIFSFTNGMVAGWSQVFVMQPFEIIKVRLQTQSKENPQYRGIVDCLTKIIQNEGPLALYKGTVTPLIGVGFLGSIRFGIYENIKKYIAKSKGIDGQPGQLQIIDKTIAAFQTGIFTSLLVCTVQHTRIRIQIQKGQADKIYSGSLNAVVKIFKQHGIKGLQRGQTPTTIRESTGLCLYFTSIEKLTKELTPANCDKNHVPIYVPLIAGGVGGTAYWVFNYPFDYVKTLMQADTFGNFKYPSMVSCFKEQYALGGWRTFFKGYVICMMRSFPVNAAAITVYRFMQKITGTHSH